MGTCRRFAPSISEACCVRPVWSRDAERSFNSLEVDAYFLEYDSQRAGGFAPLRFMPQCGFASHRKGTALTFAEQEAKLKLVVETATEVWGEA